MVRSFGYPCSKNTFYFFKEHYQKTIFWYLHLSLSLSLSFVAIISNENRIVASVLPGKFSSKYIFLEIHSWFKVKLTQFYATANGKGTLIKLVSTESNFKKLKQIKVIKVKKLFISKYFKLCVQLYHCWMCNSLDKFIVKIHWTFNNIPFTYTHFNPFFCLCNSCSMSYLIGIKQELISGGNPAIILL